MSAISIAALAAPLGCGEPFTAGGGGAGGTTSSTTTTSSSSAGGAGGDTTSSSSTGMGGEGGSAPECVDGDGKCGATGFCAPDGHCASCSDLSYPLEFGAPAAIDVSPGNAPAFPRVRDGQNTPQMVFAATSSGDNYDIAASAFTGGQWTNGVWVGPPVNTGTPETGPLRLPIGVGLPGLDLVGDQDVLLFTALDLNGSKKVYASGAGTKTQVPAVNDGDESYSIAVAHQLSPPRYWFMNRRPVGSPSVSKTDLMTKLSAEALPHVVGALTLPNGCPVTLPQGTDLAPWATGPGDLLLFQAGNPPAGCVGELLPRIFYVRIDVPTGLPIGNVKEPQIDTLPADAAVLTPSLSPDSCTIYFASDFDGERTLYSARRQ